jgi:hypothetical protein
LFVCALPLFLLFQYLATSQKAVTEVIEHSLRLLLPAEHLARQVTHRQELSELVQLWGGQVPVFVCTTGFPGVPCLLYVCEPRYRVMMRHCAEAGTREFGIVACLSKDPGNKRSDHMFVILIFLVNIIVFLANHLVVGNYPEA